MVEHGLHVAQGNWSPEEAQQRSTWRELVAAGRVLESVASKLGNVCDSLLITKMLFVY